MRYAIKQLRNIDGCNYAFASYSFAKEQGMSLDDYKTVYEGDIEHKDNINESLEELFYIFNINQPSDFRGHSLSVSDIVEINGINYYCDRCGWSEVK